LSRTKWVGAVPHGNASTICCAYLGAGGGALPLLQKSGIPEGRGYGGFPVSGIWLRCGDPEVNKRHHAKVYGKASVGSPPMSVPHLDTRVIGGKHSILFGPYAGFSTKFLKHGSLMDLFESIRLANIGPLLAVARHNFDLTKYDRPGFADVASPVRCPAGILSARQTA
jgi:malate dehydrogenase (quinone)